MFSRKHHKIIVFILALLFMLSVPVFAFADEITANGGIVIEPTESAIDIDSILEGTEISTSVADPLEIDASSMNEAIFKSATTVMLFDAISGDILYSKNPDTRIYPASTTKLLSVMLAIEAGIQDRDVTCTVCADDYSADNSLMGIVRNETIPGIELLYGMMLPSGNDAAANVAIETAGTIEGFANLMNEKAAELGMTSSHFMNPSGVQDENHYTTGNDMKKLAMYAYRNDLFMQLCGTKKHIVEPTDLCKKERTLTNTNRLIVTPTSLDPTVKYQDYTYAYATGMKTGYTYSANGCLVASAKKDENHEYIVLIYDDQSESGKNRWDMAIELFDFAFNNFSRIKPAEYLEPYTVTEQVRNISKNDNEKGRITFTADTRALENQELTVTNVDAEALANGTLKITQKVNLWTVLAAPLQQGEAIGEVDYYINDRCIGQASLVATRRVYAEGEEDLQDQTQSEQAVEQIAKTDVMQEIGQNKNVLWWILIPIAVIAIIIIRAVYVAKKRSRMRRMSARNRYRQRPRQTVYRPNQRKQTRYRTRNRF